MDQHNRGPYDDPEEAPTGRRPPPLVWHPATRAVLWIKDWAIFALSAAVVWEFLGGRGFALFSVPGPTLARAAWILIALALAVVVLMFFETWWYFFSHVRREYDRQSALIFMLVISAVLLVPLAAYLWFADWMLDRAWSLLDAWFAGMALRSPKQDPMPAGTLAILLLLFVGGLWLFIVLLRRTVGHYASLLRTLGAVRLLKGMLIMTLCRFWQPRRDMFKQAPVVSDMFPIAVCVAISATIPIDVFAWLTALLSVGAVMAFSLEKIEPPTWLFLGPSEFESLLVFDNLRKTWSGNGVTLLDREGGEGAAYYHAHAAYMMHQGSFWHRFHVDPSTPRLWSLRTRPSLWEQTVLLLIDFVPVVIVDVRVASDHLKQELLWLTEPGRLERTWFLGTEDGQAPGFIRVVPYSHRARKHVFTAMETRVVSEADLYRAEWHGSSLKVAADSSRPVLPETRSA